MFRFVFAGASLHAYAAAVFFFSIGAPVYARSKPEPSGVVLPTENLRHFTSRLPLLHVTTESGEEIGKEGMEARVALLDGEENRSREILSMSAPWAAEVKTRGNSSAKFRKKQFDLEFHSIYDSKKEAPISLLGMPKHTKWVLASNYLDRALIRNATAFELARALPHSEGPWYAPRSQPIELFVNGRYLGVYFLTEKIDFSRDRMNLGKFDFDNISDSPFMVKVEKKKDLQSGDYFDSWNEESKVTYAEPKAKKLRDLEEKNPAQVQRARAYIESKVREFENALLAIQEGDYRTYREVVDVESFLNFMLVQEVMKNVDGFRRSLTLYYKNGRMHLGPVWDFDLSAANVLVWKQMRPSGFQSGHGYYIDGNREIFWFKALLSDPRFARELASRYRNMRQKGGPLSHKEFFGKMKDLVEQISAAAERNFTVWDPNPSLKDGMLSLFIPKYGSDFRYDDAANDLRKYLLQRLEWLDNNVAFIGMKERDTAAALPMAVSHGIGKEPLDSVGPDMSRFPHADD